MSIAGGDDMIIHEEAGTEIGPVKLLLERQQVIVANRAAEIMENSWMDQCRHVKEVKNPALIGTRGMTVEGLKESVWLKGPPRLQRSKDSWPKP